MSGAASGATPRQRINEVRRLVGLLRTLPSGQRKAAARRLVESRSRRQARLDAALRNASGRLVFVCHGNIMRSAFAAAYLQSIDATAAEQIVGAGTHARDGKLAEPTAVKIATEMQVSLDAHRATSLQARHISGADIVVCMDRANEADVLVTVGPSSANVFLIGDIADGPAEILDPYAQGEAATRAAFTSIARLALLWKERVAASRSASA